jgi:hypothetical protein
MRGKKEQAVLGGRAKRSSSSELQGILLSTMT